MLQLRAYTPDSDGVDTIAIGAGGVVGVTDNGSGKARVQTTGVHGISQKEVDDGFEVTIAGNAQAAYNVTHIVTEIIDANNFDTDIDYTVDGAGGTFPVEKIYPLSQGLLSSFAVKKLAATLQTFVTLQEVKRNNKFNANLVWVQVGTDTDDYFKGDSSLLGGFRVLGNPAAVCKVVVSQGGRWF